MKYSIALVDDEETIRDSLDLILGITYDIHLYGDAESFIGDLDTVLPDVVLMDIGLPAMDGIQALSVIKKAHPELPVIMITAYEDIHMVIKSMKMGAFDFILKPINPDIIELTLEKAVASIALVKEVRLLQEKCLRENEPCFIGESKDIENIMDFIDMVAKSPDTPIMILGETGTGKELIARAIHARSPVFNGPMVSVNCSAFPEELLESELFGYEPGAFSGARPEGKKGFIEEAQDGTLFLDEVGDLSPAGQAKLLRFLESGEFYKLGSTRKQQVRVRIVSATNKELQELVEKGEFRRDLYFRLCVIKAEIPSLNQRPGDIILLAKHFLNEFNQKFGKSLVGFSPAARDRLLNHNFTGNVRELKNIVERAVLVARGEWVEELSLGLASPIALPGDRLPQDSDCLCPKEIPHGGIHLDAFLSKVERAYMDAAMEQSGHNESRAARLLQMNHHTFRYRWKKIKNS